MEVRKLEVTKEMQRDGILNRFSIPETGDMDCGTVTIHEFSDHYEVIIEKEEKVDPIDLSSALFDLTDSPFFTKTKYVLFGKKHKIYFEEKEDYNSIFPKVKNIFKKVAT